MGTEFSLRLGFAEHVSFVRLTAGEGYGGDLRRLAAKFPSSAQVSTSMIDVDVDDFMSNLGVLSGWSDPKGVVWDQRLADLATDSYQDAQAVETRLEREDLPGDLTTERVRELIGPNWKEAADITDFQARDIARLVSLRHGANFSVPGAGKTRVGLAVFEVLRIRDSVSRILIVGPKSCYEAWEHENRACLIEPLRSQRFDGSIDPSTEMLIINYERLDRATPLLAQWLSSKSSLLLLDEAHRMKRGAKGTYGSACLALGPHAQHRLILTGTPAPNGASDLANLFGFVWPGYGRRTVMQAIGDGNLAEASRVLKPLFTRTTKNELDLPPVSVLVRSVPLSPLHREIYDALVGQMSARATEHEADFATIGRILMYLLMAATTPALLSVGTTRHEPLPYQVPPLSAPEGAPLYQLMQDLPAYEIAPKYLEVVRIIRENAERGRKTLVWSTFVRSLNSLGELLADFNPAIVHGGTMNREEEIERFRNDPHCNVLLSNPATLGEGISLHHECHDAVYVDRDFAAGKYLQSLDRIHRLGLSPDIETRVTILSSPDTIDDVVNARLGEKLEFMGSILDDPSVRLLADPDEDEEHAGGMTTADASALVSYLSGKSS